MTLLTSLHKRSRIVLTILALFCTAIFAKTPKKFTLSGKIVGDNGDAVKKAEVTVLFHGE